MGDLKLYLTYDDVLLIPAKGRNFLPKESVTKSKITKKIELDKPVIASGMPTVTESKMAITVAEHGGVGVIQPFLSLGNYSAEILKVKNKGLIVGAAVADGDLEKVETAYRAGADFVAIDAGHGHNDFSLNFIKKVKRKYPKKEIMAGCFVTAQGVEDAIKAGADSVRVGIGSGSHCTTRVVSGVGVPQLSAILECAKVTGKYKIPLIAEGGIREPGDVAKAIAAGASAVMIGGMFSGTDESPGDVIEIDGAKYKKTWGYSTNKADEMAAIRSREIVSLDRKVKDLIKKLLGYKLNNQVDLPKPKIVEGVENAMTLYKGSVVPIFESLNDGLKLGMAYCGSETISEFQKKARFIQITSASLTENYPHDIFTK